MSVDKLKFYKASTLLKSLRANLPKGDIGLNHVEDYHSFLDTIEDQIKTDLSEFRIPKSALKSHAIPNTVSYDMSGHALGEPYSYLPYCDGDAFRSRIDAVILFIDTYMDDLIAALKSSQK